MKTSVNELDYTSTEIHTNVDVDTPAVIQKEDEGLYNELQAAKDDVGEEKVTPTPQTVRTNINNVKFIS